MQSVNSSSYAYNAPTIGNNASPPAVLDPRNYLPPDAPALRSPELEVTHVEPPPRFFTGAPDASPQATLRAPQDISSYRVSPRNLRGLQADRNGIYTRVNPNQSRTYFTTVDRSVYQVGEFDLKKMTWNVLDPRSGKGVATLERRNGTWAPKDVAPAPVAYPSTPRGRVLRALDDGINGVRQARTQLRQAWSRSTNWAMNKLYNRNNFTEGNKSAIERGFNGTLRDLEQNKRDGARRLIVGFEGGPNSPSAVAFNDGTISFSRYAVNTMRPADLRELTVHEHTHTGAGTADHWYLRQNHDRFPNWGGNLSPFTFQNAVNNADTLARSSSVLENNV